MRGGKTTAKEALIRKSKARWDTRRCLATTVGHCLADCGALLLSLQCDAPVKYTCETVREKVKSS